jgi:hypothetical protein
MSLGVALLLFVLFVLVAIAGASFFRHTLVVLVVLLQAAFGTGVSVFAVGLLAAVVAVIHTIADTLRLCRAAQRPRRRPARDLAAPERAPRSQSDRSRIAA